MVLLEPPPPFACGCVFQTRSCLQSSKVLAKHELLKVPLIGWTWYFLEIVFCKRKWEEDRKTVFSGLNRLKDYPECMWVGIGHTAPCCQRAPPSPSSLGALEVCTESLFVQPHVRAVTLCKRKMSVSFSFGISV